MAYIKMGKININTMQDTTVEIPTPKIADRLLNTGEYYFSAKLREIDNMRKAGKDVINLGIGSPDMPPHPKVVQVLAEEAAKPFNHGYQNYKGHPKLRQAAADWYQHWYNISLDPEKEILPLIGSKEGIMHICMTYLNASDEVLIPDPGYPAYKNAASIAGANIQAYTLTCENNWLPDFDELATRDLSRVKLMFVNYPHMPTGQLPTETMFGELIAFAKTHHILVCHDNPYSFILNDNPLSLLAVPGAKDVVIELNSLSKSHNMAGWRVGLLCGSEARINEVIRFKSNMDSGMFLPLQLAAAEALSLDAEWYQSVNDVYKKRKQKVMELMVLLGCDAADNQAGLFVWASVPAKYADGYALSDAVLYGANVFITPGGIFGDAGKKYIRISLCATEEKIDEAINRIKKQL